MKPNTLLLAVSVAANAALLATFAFRPALAPPAFRDFFRSEADRAADLAVRTKAAEAKAAADAKAAAAKKAGVWATLQTDDLKALIARLRAAGFSPAVIRAIVSARIDALFSARMTELAGMIDTPYWKPSQNAYLNSKYQEARSQVYRDRTKAMKELLGDDYFAGIGDVTAQQKRLFGDLPKAKIDLIQRVVDDYTEMASQIKAGMQGITLPEDREKLALLEKEKHADLAALLSPAELEDYEMRNSPILNRLRGSLTVMDASAEEFAAIYRAQQPYASTLYPTTGGGTTQAMMRERNEAQAKVNEALKVSLGAERYADYTRASDYEYQNLYRMAQRDNVPVTAINQAYNVRDTIAKESISIQENSALTPEQRNAAQQELAAKARTQITAAVGSTAAEAYIKDAYWLNALQKGYTLRFMPDGRISYSPPAPAPPAPGP
jgi:hypothetical protein